MDGEWRPCLFFTISSFPLPFCLGCPQLGNKYDGYCLVSCGNVFSSSHVHKYEKWGHNFLFLQNQGGHRQSNIREAGQVKNHWFTWRANQWPLDMETFFFSVPPPSSSEEPWRAFWVGVPSFKGLELPFALLLELQRVKDTVKCAALGAEVQEHCLEQLT